MLPTVAALVLGMMPPVPPPTSTCAPRIVAAAPTAADPWVQIVNDCDAPVMLEDYVLRYTGQGYGFGAQELAGELAPGECSIVRGFDPPLQAGHECADAIGLFEYFADALTSAPMNAVVYGDESCEPFSTLIDVPVSPRPWQRLQLGANGWSIKSGSTPPQCEPLTRDLGFSAACYPLSDLSDEARAQLCSDFPYGRPEECGAGGPTEAECLLRLPVFARCDLTSCEYTACAEALAVGACDELPEACDPIVECFDESGC
jgi:hypothetical protein